MLTPAPTPAPALVPLRTVLTPLPPAKRQAFALACARHALEALPLDEERSALRVALHLDGAAGRQAVLRHAWGMRACGLARYLAWQAAYWATWPSAQGTWAAEQAAWFAQYAVAESSPPPGTFVDAASAEAAWQRAWLHKEAPHAA
jgi:hypothetical protein